MQIVQELIFVLHLLHLFASKCKDLQAESIGLWELLPIVCTIMDLGTACFLRPNQYMIKLETQTSCFEKIRERGQSSLKKVLVVFYAVLSGYISLQSHKLWSITVINRHLPGAKI